MARWAKETPPPWIGAPPPERAPRAPIDRAEPVPGELHGTGASAGIARGPARVLMSLDESDRLAPGDVLVARTTMPAWTPLFAVAAALVTEVGGMLSHPAVTAREYGLPAVLNVADATRTIRDGQLVEVDGTTGVVRIVAS
jgi:phosphoenolpyruvate synthase/pyruvate phosphate dikinase